MAVNLTAPFLLGQRFGPRMAARGWGRIINIASQQSIRAFGNSGVYGVSKAGIVALTRSQAEAWSKAGVCADPARSTAMAGRNGDLADFQGVVVFLASHASDYVTGRTIS